jgi:hypothetical protein
MSGRETDIPTLKNFQGEIGGIFDEGNKKIPGIFEDTRNSASKSFESTADQALDSFNRRKDSASFEALKSIPVNLRNTGVGQAAIEGVESGISEQLGALLSSLSSQRASALSEIDRSEAGAKLGFEQGRIDSLINDLFGGRAAQAGLEQSKIASETAKNTGGEFGRGGFLGLGF